MWAIMKEFKLLPNDPRLISLTYIQREFIILSMNQDAHEQELAAKGMKEEGSYNDKSFEKTFYSNKEESLLEGDEDLDKMYQQSLMIKRRDDEKHGIYEDYDQEISNRIEMAYEEKMDKLRNTKEQVQDNWEKLIEDSKQFMDNEDE